MEQERNGTRTERNENGTMKKKRERTNLAEDPRSRTERNDLRKVGTCPALPPRLLNIWTVDIHVMYCPLVT